MLENYIIESSSILPEDKTFDTMGIDEKTNLLFEKIKANVDKGFCAVGITFSATEQQKNMTVDNGCAEFSGDYLENDEKALVMVQLTQLLNQPGNEAYKEACSFLPITTQVEISSDAQAPDITTIDNDIQRINDFIDLYPKSALIIHWQGLDTNKNLNESTQDHIDLGMRNLSKKINNHEAKEESASKLSTLSSQTEIKPVNQARSPVFTSGENIDKIKNVLKKIGFVIEEKKELNEARAVKDKNNQVQFVIEPFKFTTQSKEVNTFIYLLESFKAVHDKDSTTMPKITAPDKETEERWKFACIEVYGKEKAEKIKIDIGQPKLSERKEVSKSSSALVRPPS